MVDRIFGSEAGRKTMDPFARSIRMVSINGIHHKPAWIKFNITDDGNTCLRRPIDGFH